MVISHLHKGGARKEAGFRMTKSCRGHTRDRAGWYRRNDLGCQLWRLQACSGGIHYRLRRSDMQLGMLRQLGGVSLSELEGGLDKLQRRSGQHPHTAACGYSRADSGVDSGRAGEQLAGQCEAPESGSQKEMLLTL